MGDPLPQVAVPLLDAMGHRRSFQDALDEALARLGNAAHLHPGARYRIRVEPGRYFPWARYLKAYRVLPEPPC